MLKRTLVIPILISMIFFEGCNEQVIPQETATVDIDYKDEIALGKDEGFTIISAVEAFYDDTGHYPNSLRELVPTYIDDIPLTSTGQHFELIIDDVDIYRLWFPVKNHDLPSSCSYIKRLEFWDCSHGETHYVP